MNFHAKPATSNLYSFELCKIRLQRLLSVLTSRLLAVKKSLESSRYQIFGSKESSVEVSNSGKDVGFFEGGGGHHNGKSKQNKTNCISFISVKSFFFLLSVELKEYLKAIILRKQYSVSLYSSSSSRGIDRLLLGLTWHAWFGIGRCDASDRRLF